MKQTFRFPFLLFFIAFISLSQKSLAEDEIILEISSEVDITIERYPSSGSYLIVWLAPEYGLRPNHRTMARLLSQQKIEVWFSNIVESLYLPQSSKSLKQLDGNYVADIIEYAHKTTGKKILLVGDSYAAISALRGAHQWQQRKQEDSYLIGSILFSPSLYAYIPPLGLAPEFMPITSASNIPMMIYQGQKSGNITQFKLMLDQLQQHDNPVYSQIIPNIRSLFYAEKPTEEVVTQIKSLAPNLTKMITVLEKYEVPSKVIPFEKVMVKNSGLDNFLKEYKGLDSPRVINLVDAYGAPFYKADYKEQITIVNFWATWCPPCVEEIPSLNRLKKAMENLPFELISINYAEDKQTILDFMKKVNVEFPVLLDQDGDFAKKWNVVTYPSTFVIDPDGNIKYGVNAAIEWDDPQFIETMKSMFK